MLDLLLQVGPRRELELARSTAPPFIWYSDASYEADEEFPCGVWYALHANCIQQPRLGVAEPPRQYVDSFGQARTSGPLVFLFDEAQHLLNQKGIIFFDNTGAVAAHVKGVGGPLDTAAIPTTTQLMLAQARISLYFEFVETAVTWAEHGSRFRYDIYLRSGYEVVAAYLRC